MSLGVAVVIAHYGSKNALHLSRVLQEWSTTPAIVTVLTGDDLFPGASPTSLPFVARKVLVDRFLTGEFDLFVYSEDDMLITPANLAAWLEITRRLRPSEVAGFVRYEVDPHTGERRFPDMHGAFHWRNVEAGEDLLIAEFSNVHQGCYVLNPVQLRLALDHGGFLVPPHADATYGMLERGASDVFLQCGLRRVVPLSRFEEFLIRHLPANYLHLGKPEAEVRAELKAMGVEWKP